MRRRTHPADADFLSLEIGQSFEFRPADEDMKRPVEPPHHSPYGKTLNGRARNDAADRRIVEFSSDQSGHVQIRAHHDFTDVETLLFVKTFALGDLGGNFVETRC